MLELTEAQVKSYEGGKANPDQLTIDRICTFSGVAETDLFGKRLREQDIKIAREEKGEKVENGSSDYSKILSEVLSKLDINYRLLLQLLSYETGMSVEELKKSDLDKLKIERTYKKSSRS